MVRLNMKKIIFAFLIVAMLITLCACNNDISSDIEDDTTTQASEDSSSETETTETPEEEIQGDWVIKNYVDEFNEPTLTKYITTKSKLTGTFSNTATNNSELKANILVDSTKISIMLYEYGRNQVKSNSNDDYKITIKYGYKKVEISGMMNLDRIHIWGNSKQEMITALSSGKTVSLYIVNKDRKTTTYLFSVESSNFADAYDEIKLKDDYDYSFDFSDEQTTTEPPTTDEIQKKIKAQLAEGVIEAEYIGYAADMDLSFLSESEKASINKCISNLKKVEGCYDGENCSYYIYIADGCFYFGDSKNCYKMETKYNINDNVWEDATWGEDITEVSANSFQTTIRKYTKVDIDDLPSCFDEYISLHTGG